MYKIFMEKMLALIFLIGSLTAFVFNIYIYCEHVCRSIEINIIRIASIISLILASVVSEMYFFTLVWV